MNFDEARFIEVKDLILAGYPYIESIEPIPECRDDNKNCSYISGGDIRYGDYEGDYELLILSIFHELGHAKIPKWLDVRFDMDYYLDSNLVEGIATIDKFVIERQAWIDGLRMARFMGIHFSQRAILWAKQQLVTYATITKDCGR